MGAEISGESPSVVLRSSSAYTLFEMGSYFICYFWDLGVFELSWYMMEKECFADCGQEFYCTMHHSQVIKGFWAWDSLMNLEVSNILPVFFFHLPSHNSLNLIFILQNQWNRLNYNNIKQKVYQFVQASSTCSCYSKVSSTHFIPWFVLTVLWVLVSPNQSGDGNLMIKNNHH